MRTLPPLLAEPAPPFLVAHDALPHDADDLAAAARWRYDVRYRHEHRPQDEVVVTASFNDLPDAATAGGDAPPRFAHRVVAQFDCSDDGEHIEALRLTCEDGAPGPAGRWPDAEYLAPSSDAVALGNGTGDGNVRTYVFDPPVDAEAWPGVALSWSGLDVASAQSARASLAVIRNRHTDGGDEAIYRTATVDAAAAVAPLLRRPHDFDIGDLGDTVEAALDAALATLFGERTVGQRVSIALYYGYSPVPAGALADAQRAAFMVWLPVGLSADGRIAATTAREIAATLAAWKDASLPPPAFGAWAFSVVQYAQFDQAPRPLLDLGRLVWRLR